MSRLEFNNKCLVVVGSAGKLDAVLQASLAQLAQTPPSLSHPAQLGTFQFNSLGVWPHCWVELMYSPVGRSCDGERVRLTVGGE